MGKHLKKKKNKQRFIFLIIAFIFILLSSTLVSGYTTSWFISQKNISFEFEMNIDFEE